MFKSPLACEHLELSTAGLPSIVTDHYLWYPVLTKDLFQDCDDSITCALSFDFTDERKLTVIISDDDVVVVVEIHEVCADILPWTCWYLMWHQWFFPLGFCQ